MRRRVHYLVDKKFQLAFAAKIAFVSVLISGFIGLQVYVILWPVLCRFVPDHAVGLIHQQLVFRGIVFLSLGAIFIIIISIVISHRIAGPMYSINRTLDRIVRKDQIEYIRLRKHDELKDLAEKINGLISILKKTKEP